tara:strand:- start:1457 stop:1771 length:315 start_codon:yes stop_codon:yes gene_type:complete
MKITKQQIQNIIKEEQIKLLKENVWQDQVEDLVFDIIGSGEPGVVAQEMLQHLDTLANKIKRLIEIEEDDMADEGYEDGLNGAAPLYPDNDVYMSNYEHGEEAR